MKELEKLAGELKRRAGGILPEGAEDLPRLNREQRRRGERLARRRAVRARRARFEGRASPKSRGRRRPGAAGRPGSVPDGRPVLGKESTQVPEAPSREEGLKGERR